VSMLSMTMNKHAACSMSHAQVCYLGVCFSDFAADSTTLILAACHDFVLQQVEDSLNAYADTHCCHILTAEHAHQLVIPALYVAHCHWTFMCRVSVPATAAFSCTVRVRMSTKLVSACAMPSSSSTTSTALIPLQVKLFKSGTRLSAVHGYLDMTQMKL
jgi:hypothetical protein